MWCIPVLSTHFVSLHTPTGDILDDMRSEFFPLERDFASPICAGEENAVSSGYTQKSAERVCWPLRSEN